MIFPLKNRQGQAIVEYLLLVVMLAVSVAVIIRNTNANIYRLWTGLARQIAKPCAECETPAAPDIPQ